MLPALILMTALIAGGCAGHYAITGKVMLHDNPDLPDGWKLQVTTVPATDTVRVKGNGDFALRKKLQPGKFYTVKAHVPHDPKYDSSVWDVVLTASAPTCSIAVILLSPPITMDSSVKIFRERVSQSTGVVIPSDP